MYRVACATLVAGCISTAIPARAQIVLTFEDTVARAREAGTVAVARARIPEAEAGVVDAAARFRDNPLLEASVGPRRSDGARSTDVEFGISQQFETGGQRGARLAGAQARVERVRAESDHAARLAMFDAASAFLSGVAANERLRLAEEAETVSRDLLNATERRYAVGDVAGIDVNLARIDAARTAADLVSARADLTAALGTLRAILRLPAGEPIELRGTLDASPLPALAILETLIDQRPEFAALAAEARAADAQAQLGRAATRPDLGFRVGYQREEADTIVLGGLTVTLPAFQRGRGALAAGLAQANRVRLEEQTLREFARAELRAAYEVYTQRAALADAFAQSAAPNAADNETLGRRSYDAGEMNLMDFLLIRRDALDTRGMVIDRRLDAARSRLEVDFIAGGLR